MRRNRRNFKYLFGLFVLFAFHTFLIGSVSTNAQQSTQVGAYICSTENPEIQVSTPLSDSVTSSAIIQVEGVALYTSQIDIYINGQYSHSVAIGFDSIFQTQVSLQVGTNTITLEGYYSCNGGNSEVDIIVDYQPAVVPTSPENLDSQLPSLVPGNTVSSKYRDSPSSVEEFKGSVREKLGFQEEIDDLGFPKDRSFVRVVFSWVTLLLVLLLFALLFAPGLLIERALGLIGWDLRSVQRNHKIVHLSIVFLIIVFSTLFSIS